MTSRSFCFTLNNYTEEDIVNIKDLGNFKYLIFGKEVGESGTPHLQGFVYYLTNRSLRAVKKDIPRAHFEVKKGTFKQAIDYCKKDDNYCEVGVAPIDAVEKGDKQRVKWAMIMEKARVGDEDWLLENHPDIYFNQLHNFRSHRVFDLKTLVYHDKDTPHEWWHGETGTGKSKLLHENYPNAYPKNISKWWCGYRGEDVVYIEEWPLGLNDIMIHHMKKWVDRYKFLAEIKGGSMIIRPKKVIVLSNFSLEQCFPNKCDLDPLKRRFKIIHFAHL